MYHQLEISITFFSYERDSISVDATYESSQKVLEAIRL